MRIHSLLVTVYAAAILLIGVSSAACEDNKESYSTPQIALEWKVTRISEIRLQITGELRNTDRSDLSDADMTVRGLGKDDAITGSSRFVFYPKVIKPNDRLPFGMMLDLDAGSDTRSLEFNLYFGSGSKDILLPGFVQFIRPF